MVYEQRRGQKCGSQVVGDEGLSRAVCAVPVVYMQWVCGRQGNHYQGVVKMPLAEVDSRFNITDASVIRVCWL